MDQAQALAVVRSLANGVDPESGEVFTPEQRLSAAAGRAGAVRSGRGARAHRALRAASAQMPPKTGEPWSEDEDRKLLAAFDAGRALQELAAAHERTMGAVRARLLKYGRINAWHSSGFSRAAGRRPGLFRECSRISE